MMTRIPPVETRLERRSRNARGVCSRQRMLAASTQSNWPRSSGRLHASPRWKRTLRRSWHNHIQTCITIAYHWVIMVRNKPDDLCNLLAASNFYRATRMHSADYAVVAMSVCPSVRPSSPTFVSFINKRIYSVETVIHTYHQTFFFTVR